MSIDLRVMKQIDILEGFCLYNAFVLSDAEVLFNCIDNNAVFIVNIETDEVKKN